MVAVRSGFGTKILNHHNLFSLESDVSEVL